jgi:Zn-dependent metalloprotease
LSALLALAVAGATLSVVAGTGGAVGAPRADAQSIAAERLSDDASGALTRRSEGGVLDFVGVPAGETLDNPAVSSTASVGDAADAHLARYGAAFGTKRPGTTLTRAGVMETLVGDVVRYQQHVGGLPVMGGELVLSLRQDRELDSILAKTSQVTKVPAARVTASDAVAKAQSSFVKATGAAGAATVSAKGRWVIDPALIGAADTAPVRTAYRYELTRGAHERRLVLVDDQTGVVVMNSDLIGHAKRRIVCDNAEVGQNPNAADAACTNASANKVRGEGDPAAALAEANTAYDLGGATHDGFAAFGIADLTELIGRDIGGGVKALSQTVRWCYTGSTCPYPNAFWNGQGMYYGTGYAVADDVVGHEMAHGVTERTSNLVYFGQSGAINESLSDIFGEIIDHRNVGPGDTAGDFRLGEDLPIGHIRNMANPGEFGDPDRTGSPDYVKEVCGSVSCYPDLDGVHQNSGVSNKTFYLASQGGTFNGQTITGIDVGDPNLTKSGRLWLLVDQMLTSGSDFADLGVVLNQACTQLQNASVVTAANCTAVAQAGTATELAVTPTLNPQPADAPATCPTGTIKRVLFDSETGDPATKFVAGTGWSRDGTADWGQIAHSGTSAWSNQGVPSVSTRPLTVAAPIALPAGQPAYLHFQHWRVLDYFNSNYYDGGQVDINGTSTTAGTWVNGPEQTISASFSSPIASQKAFGGDSRGYLASRLDLSSFAGQSVTPKFTLYTDSTEYFLGWWLDDITVYTCDPPPPVLSVVAGTVTVKGKLFVGKKLKAKVAGWSPTDVTYTYQWLRNGKAIKKATGKKYKLTKKAKGKKLQVRVTATKAGYTPATVTSKKTKKIKQ